MVPPDDPAAEARLDGPDALLPVVRVEPAWGISSLGRRCDGIAIDHDRLLVFTVYSNLPIPDRTYEPGGLDALLLPGAVRECVDLPAAEIEKIEIGPLGFFGSRWRGKSGYGHVVRVTRTDGSLFQIGIPRDDAAQLLAGLGMSPVLAEKVTRDPPPGNLAADARWMISRPRNRFSKLPAPLFALAVILGTITALLPAKTGDWWILPGALALVFFLVALVGALALLARAGSIHQAVKSKLNEEAARATRKHSKHDHSHLRPLRSRRWGVILKILGAVGFFLAAFGNTWLLRQYPQIASLAPIISALIYIPATCLIYYGYRLSLRSAEDAREEDHRQPILYLRSFDQDSKSNLNPAGFMPQLLGLEMAGLLRRFGPLANANPVRLLRLIFSRSADHSEEQLAAYFQKLGPFVAIGKPGERLALGGASRFYVGDEEWRESVLRLIEESSIVVLQPGESEHVWWEVRETFARAKPEDILFCLASCHGEQWRYEKFRLRFERETGRTLPRGLGTNGFLHFTGESSRLLPMIWRWHFTWPLAGCAIDLKRTLRPFLAAREGREIAPEKPRGRFVHSVSAMSAVACWTLAIGLCFFLLTTMCLKMSRAYTVSKMAARLQIPERRQWIEGDPGLPFRLALTRDWQPKPVPFWLMLGSPNLRVWQFDDVATLTINHCSAAKADPATLKRLMEPAALVATEIDGLKRTLREGMEVLDTGTVNQAGRTWQVIRARSRVKPGFSTDAEVRNGAPSFRMASTVIAKVRAYAGSDGIVELITTIHESMVPSLEPVMEKVFAGFTLGSPLEIATHSGEAARLENLITAREGLPQWLATYQAGPQGRKYPVPEDDRVLELRPPWTSNARGGYHFGAAAELRVVSIPAPGGLPLTTPAEVKSDLLSRGMVLENFSADAAAPTGQPLVVRYDGATGNQRVRMLHFEYPAGPGRTLVEISTYPEMAAELESILLEAGNALRATTPAQLEIIRSLGASPSGKLVMHPGRTGQYQVQLDEGWQEMPQQPPLDRIFQFGPKASFFVVAEAREGLAGPFGTGDLMNFARTRAGPSFALISNDVRNKDGMTWGRMKYYAAPQGTKLRFTGHYLVTATGIYQVVGCSEFLYQQAHDEVIDAAFHGFKLMPAAK